MPYSTFDIGESMSMLEAQADGIRCYREPLPYNTSRTHIVYELSCANCKAPIIAYNYSRNKIYICEICRKRIKEKKRIAQYIDVPDVPTKHEKRFAAACDELKSKTGARYAEYKRAIEIAKTRCEKYDSIPEAMVAIELIRNGYQIIPQQSIGRLKVDFAIPKQKLIIEVDGSAFHKDKRKSLSRDGEIQFALGLDWVIIHIPAEYIRDDIRKLNDYILKAVKISKRK